MAARDEAPRRDPARGNPPREPRDPPIPAPRAIQLNIYHSIGKATPMNNTKHLNKELRY